MNNPKKLQSAIFDTQRSILDAKCELIGHKAMLVGYRDQVAESYESFYTSEKTPAHTFLWFKSRSLADLARERASALHKKIFELEARVEDHHFYILRLEAKLERLIHYKIASESGQPQSSDHEVTADAPFVDNGVGVPVVSTGTPTGAGAGPVMHPVVGGVRYNLCGHLST